MTDRNAETLLHRQEHPAFIDLYKLDNNF